LFGSGDGRFDAVDEGSSSPLRHVRDLTAGVISDPATSLVALDKRLIRPGNTVVYRGLRSETEFDQ
jgi:hypothetical protein